eukprot:scaffold122511_cov21-Tisochrysis_lutea.AAC.1
MPGAMVRNGRKRAHTHTHQNRTELYSITLDLGNSSKRTAQRGVCTETGVAPLMKTPSRERSAGYSNKALAYCALSCVSLELHDACMTRLKEAKPAAQVGREEPFRMFAPLFTFHMRMGAHSSIAG